MVIGWLCRVIRHLLGHIGHSWEREEFDLDFRANKPIGDFNHLHLDFLTGHCPLMWMRWLLHHGHFLLLI